MNDASIKTMKNTKEKLKEVNNKDYIVELVTPILIYEDIETLQELLRRLIKVGAVSDSELQCGIHIHIGAKDHTLNALNNLVNLIASKEDLIYKILEIDPARVRCCKKSNEDLIEAINKKKPKTLEQLAHIDNEKYTFRYWLLRLGLIGEEFKNYRMHLMKALDGNSAWYKKYTLNIILLKNSKNLHIY